MIEKRTSSILIVDDNANNLQVLANMLRGEKYRVAVAKDGFRALTFIRNKMPDLILLDVMMPEMDGYEVCAKLKAHEETKDIPVVFISALDNVEDKLKGFACGGVDYITKPFRREEVLARIGAHLTLRQAREDLKLANQTKDKLLSIIAHDLRGPISSLAGMIELIEQKPAILDEQNRDLFLNELGASMQSVLHLTENLLSWAKNQRNALDCRPEILSLKSLLQSTIDLFHTAANKKGIKLHLILKNEIMVYADRHTIMAVMRNLLSNALKFTPESGNVRLEASSRGDIVEIGVTDDGIGIPRKNIEKLFQDRENLTTFGTQNEKGSGLGLIICKEFVEKNHGKIWVESEHGEGSRFVFTLPIALST